MNKSIKLLIASVIILACSVGFFIGATVFQGSFTLKTTDSKSIERDDSNRRWERNRSDRKRNKERRLHSSLDSILQLTPEQKVKLDSHRVLNDSLRSLSFEKFKQAETELQEALAAQPIDENAVEQAKKKLLQLNEEQLDQRIKDIRFFSATLTPEQHRSFKALHRKKGFRPRNRDLPPPPPTMNSIEQE